MAATTISTRRPNLRKVLLSLSFFSSLVSAQTPPTYGSVPASSCPGAPDGTNVTVNGGSVYSIYCGSDINGQLAIVPDITTFDGCLLACDQNPGCGAAAWDLARTCYLKPPTSPQFTRYASTTAYLGVRAVQPVSTATSSAAPSSTCAVEPPSCPASNGTTFVTVGSNVAYTIACGEDIKGNGYRDPAGVLGDPMDTICGYQECFEACNVRKTCLGFTWDGAATGSINGVGPGQCYFKQQAVDCAPIAFDTEGGTNANKCAAIRQDQAVLLVGCVPATASVFSTTFTPTPSPVVTPTTAATCTVSTPAPVASDTTTINGYCGITNGLSCGNGFGDCCSIYGACGNTSEYCSTTQCDPAYGRCGGELTTNGYCGANANGALCGSNFGDCCSQYGACGNTTAYCGAGCNSAYGRCDGSQTPNGYCGATNNGYTCGSVFGDCCSQYGSCGNDTAYCGTGCDPTYGRCDTGPPPTYVQTSAPPQYPSGAPTTAVSSAAPLQTPGGLTPNGYCGPDNSDWICGGVFGNCCSQYGSCGSDAAYCGVGCLNAYSGGACDVILPACPVSSSISSSEIPSTSSVAPIPTGGITQNGRCGPSNNFWSCGLNFGNCCSSFGFCGNTTEYCDAGCQTTYGACNPPVISSSTIIGFSTTVSSSPIPDTTTTTTTTTPFPTTTTTTTTPVPTTTTTTTPIPTTTTTTTPIPTTTTTTTPFPTTTTTTTPIPTTITTTTPFPTTTTTTTPFPTTTTTTTTPSPSPSSSSSSSSSSASPSPSSSSSPNAVSSASSIGIVNRGLCGPPNNFQNCIGSGFGNCCSQYNVCGSTDEYCGIGCQPLYGDCNPVISSSSSSSIVSSSALPSSASSSSSAQSSVLSSIASSLSSSVSSALLVATTTTTTSSSVLVPTSTIPAMVPACARNCLAAGDLQGCDPLDVSCICRNQDLIADYSCCLAQSCGTTAELMAIMAVGRALCACYGYFGLPTSAGCTAPAYSVTPIEQSPSTTTTNILAPTASTCGTILESVTEQIGSTSTTSSVAPTSTIAACVNTTMTSNGYTYNINCGCDIAGPGLSFLSLQAVQNSYPECFAFCDASSACAGFTYEGGSGGVGPGNCYLYQLNSTSTALTCTPAPPRFVGCIKVRIVVPPSTPASTTALITATPIPTSALPPCARPCIASYEQASCFGGCSPLDVACICSNTALVDSLSCCVSESCSVAGQQDVSNFAHALCAQYGNFTLPQNASCTTRTSSDGVAISTGTIPGCSSTISSALVIATPTPTGLPPCAQPCIASYAISSCYGGCSPLDVACICSNKPLLNELSCCVSTSCNGAGQADVVFFAHNLCEQYGVYDLPYSAGCASTLAIGATSSSATIGTCATTTSGFMMPSCLPCPKVCEKRTTVLAITASS